MDQGTRDAGAARDPGNAAQQLRADGAAELAPARVRALLRTRRFGHAYRFLLECGSTNDEAARATQAPEGLVVAADAQHGGRGRLGRSWHSPAGENLYVSLLLRPALPPERLPPLTLMAGAALARAVSEGGITARVKWPNDLLLDTPAGPRKLAGILTEMASDRQRVRHVVVGVGLNVHTAAFPAELATRATSLALHTGRAHDRAVLLCGFLAAFEELYDHALVHGPGETLALWRSFAGLPRRVRHEGDGRVREGLAVDIDPSGALLIRDDAGVLHRAVSGELVPPCAQDTVR
jgi:BirA family biotin operon repressor/biotin-[acetyl-CoA-carboxylase] ligase